ncbi:NPHP1 [Bugula neritina]|uniref:NPHP1 n=1 Tax=Bugula neritina TaxID=10212 RepID=A0A7J7IRC7_BUGNE|nr:NPHP1 [Bugula neritina]
MYIPYKLYSCYTIVLHLYIIMNYVLDSHMVAVYCMMVQRNIRMRKIKVEPEYELLYDFVAQKKGDLEVKAGEIVILRSVRDDSWWVCENQNGETGLVPSNFLKPHVKYSDLMTEDDPQTPISPRTGKELWGSIKKALSETSATDVLHAFGAVPPGFRLPTSARLHSLNEKHTLLNYGAVKLSNSNLFYKDLFYNPATSKVRPRTARIQKVVTLLEAKNIPLPGEKVVVHSRLARLSLFDGSKFLSNIVTTLAHVTDKEGRNWRFLVKPTTLESSECFVRVAEPSNQIGILIELSVVFSKEVRK